jgi:hypothetical protein
MVYYRICCIEKVAPGLRLGGNLEEPRRDAGKDSQK